VDPKSAFTAASNGLQYYVHERDLEVAITAICHCVHACDGKQRAAFFRVQTFTFVIKTALRTCMKLSGLEQPYAVHF
jgi:hypothetical protein